MTEELWDFEFHHDKYAQHVFLDVQKTSDEEWRQPLEEEDWMDKNRCT